MSTVYLNLQKEGKKAGEFYTPASIVKTLVEILKPFNGRVMIHVVEVEECCSK